MTKLAWDKIGDRFYEAGVDQGVLYPNGSEGVPWNGLISVEEAVSGGEVSSYHFDGIKYFDAVANEDFKAIVEAYTYPNEFEACQGNATMIDGLVFGKQIRETFGMSWRTKLGNDLDGIDHGYRIHIVYNATASPTTKAYRTINNQPDPVNFKWEINAVPPFPGLGVNDPSTDWKDWVWPSGVGMVGWPMGPDGNTPVKGWHPTAYVYVDSKDVDPIVLADLEDRLYGTINTPAYLPSQFDVLDMLHGRDVPYNYSFPYTPPVDPNDPNAVPEDQDPTVENIQGPWKVPPLFDSGGTLVRSGRARSVNVPQDVRYGSFSAEVVNGVINEKRLLTDGGAPISSGSADWGFAAMVDGRAQRVTTPSEGVNYDSFSALDLGIWFYARWTEQWNTYLWYIINNQPTTASGYEIEGGTEQHVEKIESAVVSFNTQTRSANTVTLVSMIVDICAAPAETGTDITGTKRVLESRTLTKSLSGSEPQDPVTLNLLDTDLAQSGNLGGVTIFPDSRQAGAPDWDTAGGADERPELIFENVDRFAPTCTYKVRFPRYRYVYPA